jgi:hypothetical protein
MITGRPSEEFSVKPNQVESLELFEQLNSGDCLSLFASSRISTAP